MLDQPSIAASPLIRIEGLCKSYGSVLAVNNLSLTISRDEFFALLGPSGCGKTSLMRLIAGFEQPDRGRILLDGIDITRMPPHLRPVNMMFQSYALFPHMSVGRNIAFGLVQEGLRRKEINARVAEILRLVQLEGLEKRMPHQLSGGQRQRVALARALVKRPKLLLLDEPLAALDRKLRHETQFELMRAQRETGTTFVVVTHDQDEAMIMAHRMAVMRTGSVEQVGSPRFIYEHPVSRHVATFVGETNLIEGRVSQLLPGGIAVQTRSGLHLEAACASPPEPGSAVALSVRPECVRLGRPTALSLNGGVGQVIDQAFREGLSSWRVLLDAGDVIHVRQAQNEAGAGSHQRGERVFVSFPPEAARVLLA